MLEAEASKDLDWDCWSLDGRLAARMVPKPYSMSYCLNS